MVVNKGDNIFFTGAAGTCFFHIYNPPSPYSGAFTPTRNGEITTAPSHHCGS